MKKTLKKMTGLFVLIFFSLLMIPPENFAIDLYEEKPSYTRRVKNGFVNYCPSAMPNGLCIVNVGGQQ